MSLSSVTLPDSVTRIEAGAFINCGSLSSINIPDSVVYIFDNAFWGTSLSEAVKERILQINPDAEF
jgi:acetyl-CoA carboxylase beta subunit